jgi:hypothetical protein
MSRRITKGRLTAGVAVIALAASGALPFLVLGGHYGDVPIPGTATVHLPAGEVDVTLRTVGPVDEPEPSLRVHICGPDGIAEPEVIESPRMKYTSDKGDMLVRVWVVRVVAEGDYHVEVQGETYGPYQSSLTFGRIMWNEPLEAVIAFCTTLSWLVLGVLAVTGLIGLIVALWAQCARRRPNKTPS